MAFDDSGTTFGPKDPNAQGYNGVDGGNPQLNTFSSPDDQAAAKKTSAVFGIASNGQIDPNWAPPGGGVTGGTNYAQPVAAAPSAPAAPAAAPKPMVARNVFNAQAYMDANPDVAAAIHGGAFGGDPYQHYLQFGYKENRNGAEGAPTAAPTTPTTPTTTPGKNQFGGSANLDPGFIRQAMDADFMRLLGRKPTESEYADGVRYATTPDVYSDGKTRVGWNGYLAQRLAFHTASADPSLAGEEGVINGYTGATRQGALGGGTGGDPSQLPTNSAMYGEDYTKVGQSFDPMAYLAQFQQTPSSAPATYDPMQAVTPTAAPVYNPTQSQVQIGEYAPPQQTALEQQLQAMGMQILGSAGDGLNPAVLKEQQKEAALQMMRDQQSQIADSAAGRGVSTGGWAVGNDINARDAMQARVLDAYRTIDMQAPQALQAARLAASQGVSGLLSDASGRAQGAYTTGLQGKQLQLSKEQQIEAARQFAAQYGLNYDQLVADNAKTAEGSRQFGATYGQNRDAQNLQAYGQSLNAAQIGQNESQFQQNFGLNENNILSNILQGKLNYGLNVAQLQQNGQNAMLQNLLSLYGGM